VSDILKGSPKLVDNLCESCSRDFEKLKSLLRDNKIDLEVDINLVEVWTITTGFALESISGRWVPNLQWQGGGRYDRWVESLDGKF